MKTTILAASVFIIQILAISCVNSTQNTQEKKATITSNNGIDTTTTILMGEEFAKLELNRFITDTLTMARERRVLIHNKEKMISLAEPILFDIYGKQNILNEKPYEIYQIGDYMIMMGTLRKGYVGGVFSIAINRYNCEVIGISHGK